METGVIRASLTGTLLISTLSVLFNVLNNHFVCFRILLSNLKWACTLQFRKHPKCMGFLSGNVLGDEGRNSEKYAGGFEMNHDCS